MATPLPEFPIAEGVGVFLGVVAWDLLVDGRMEPLKAALIAATCSLIWFGFRLWQEKTRDKRP